VRFFIYVLRETCTQPAFTDQELSVSTSLKSTSSEDILKLYFDFSEAVEYIKSREELVFLMSLRTNELAKRVGKSLF